MYPFSPRCLWPRNHFGNCSYELRSEHVADTSLIALFLLFFFFIFLGICLAIWSCGWLTLRRCNRTWHCLHLFYESHLFDYYNAIFAARIFFFHILRRRCMSCLSYVCYAFHFCLRCSSPDSIPLCAIFGECSSHILLIYHVLLLCGNAIRRIRRFHKKGQRGLIQPGRLFELSIARKSVANFDIMFMKNDWFVLGNASTRERRHITIVFYSSYTSSYIF